jgi:hypothetical protein
LKLLINAFLLLSATYSQFIYAENTCLKDDNINYDLSFLKKDSFFDKKSMVTDFKSGIKCYIAPSYNKSGVIETEYFLNGNKNNYKNIINFGEQAFFFNGKIPENSILYSHQTIPILLFQEQYLTKDDIGDYYLSFERTSSDFKKESIKTTYHSPYDFFKLSIQLIQNPISDTIVYEFNAKNDIKLLKNKIENYFLKTVNNSSLPLKLENKENMEVMRVYVNDYLNSLSVVEPFVKIFLDHIDYNKLNFSSDTKLGLIDSVYTNEKDLNPFTVFGKNILISYTFDKKRQTGLIAFSFLKDKNVIQNIKNEFIPVD